jgi:hypothetical protein
MKILGYILLLSLSFGFYTPDPQNDRLDIFMEKLEIFSKNKSKEGPWYIPYYSENFGQSNMPVISHFSVDGITGLHYSEYKGIIREPDLEIEFDVRSGKLFDLKRDQEYSIFELIKERRKRKRI